MEQTKIALLGLGLMGSGMAGQPAGRRLSAHHLESDSRQGPGIGSRVEPGWPNPPARPPQGAAVVISMLADVPVCRDVWLGRGEALVDIAPGTILMESSTVSVEWIEELDRAAKEHGCDLVDAPVTGSKPQAEAGQLLFLAGGSSATVNQVDPDPQGDGPRRGPRGPGRAAVPA